MSKLFSDSVLPMGLRSSAQICQRVSTAVLQTGIYGRALFRRLRGS